MAIDPPYRLDPFRNIVNVHWRVPEETTFDGNYTATTFAMIYGPLRSWGWNNDKRIIVSSSVNAPPGWLVNGQEYAYETNHFLIETTGDANVYVYVENASSGLYFAGTWADIGDENPKPYGTWGIDLSTYRAVLKVDETAIMRPKYLTNIVDGSFPYDAWLYCYIHWSS